MQGGCSVFAHLPIASSGGCHDPSEQLSTIGCADKSLLEAILLNLSGMPCRGRSAEWNFWDCVLLGVTRVAAIEADQLTEEHTAEFNEALVF